MANTRILLPKGQDWLINRMRLLGYPSDKKGICFGIAYMGMVAILARDTKSFDQRFAEMNNIPMNQFASTIKTANQNYIDLIHQTKSTIWKKNFPDIKEFDFTDLTIEQKTQFEKEWHENLQQLRNARPSILDIPHFFENVEVAQNAKHYPVLFEKHKIPEHQDGALISQRIYPQSFKEGDIEKVAQVSGIYTKKDLIDQFNSLVMACKQTSVADPFAMMISGVNHTIAVGYDPLENHWLFVEANQLPTSVITSTDELAKKVVASFSKNDVVIVTTEVFAKKSEIQSEIRNEHIKNWQEDENIIMMENMLEKITLADSNNNSWLFIAIKEINLELIESLLEEGADPNQVNSACVTPLFIAITQGNVEMVELLLAANANPRYENPQGHTALLLAAQNGMLDILEHLLDYVDADEVNKDGLSALHAAAHSGQLEVIELLLDIGISSDLEANDGSTAFIVAAQNGQHDAVNLLLKEQMTDINHRAIDGTTALFAAVREGQLDMVKLLLSQGADASLTVSWIDDYIDQFTEQRQVEEGMSDLVLMKTADTFLTEITPLEIADAMGYKEIAKLLKEHVLNQSAAKDKYNVQQSFWCTQPQPTNDADFAKAENNQSESNLKKSA